MIYSRDTLFWLGTLDIIIEIYHSGQKPSIYIHIHIQTKCDLFVGCVYLLSFCSVFKLQLIRVFATPVHLCCWRCNQYPACHVSLFIFKYVCCVLVSTSHAPLCHLLQTPMAFYIRVSTQNTTTNNNLKSARNNLPYYIRRLVSKNQTC